MRILHVSSEYPPQQVFGLGQYVNGLSQELAKQSHVVHVLTNSVGGDHQDVSVCGVQIHRVDFPPPPKPPGPISPLLSFNLHLQQRAHVLGFEGLGSPEVVVSHDWLTALAGERLARRFKLPHVWTVHDTVFGKRGGKLDRPGDLSIFELERWAAEVSDLILVNSRAIREEIIDAYGGSAAKIEILPCATDPDQFVSRQERSRVSEFRRMFADADDVLVTYTGRLDVEKGVDVLINAFAILHERVPKSRLAIVGRGDLKDTIDDHVRKLGLEQVVKLYGYLTGEVLKHVYIVSDIHVCPSHYEPFGIVAIEAMAAGATLVASATGGLKDIVSKPSIGRLFEPTNVKTLADTLVELAENPATRKRLGRNAAEHVRKNFAWSTVAKQAVNFYEHACVTVGNEASHAKL